MRGVRYTFRTLPPEYRELERWRTVDVSALPDDEQERFTRLKSAIEAYLRTGKLSSASKDTGISRAQILRALNRCTTIADDELIWGWAGLIRGLRLKAYHRTAALPTGSPGSVSGFAGCFDQFLRGHETIRIALDELILKKGGLRKAHEARISIKSLTLRFRDLCREAGIQEYEYPLNVLSQARRSMSRYVVEVLQRNVVKGTRARFGDVAARHLPVATGYGGLPFVFAPMDIAGLDAHEIHCVGCVIVNGPAGPQRIAIERLWLVCTIEGVSHAVLGYSIGIRTEVSAATVEDALIASTIKWQPRKLSIRGLRYREGAALPSGVLPELVGCFPAILKVDNAAVNYSRRIAERARRRLGCAVTFGAVGHWEHNPVVERLFKTLETYGFQRLPSTTGSNVTDTIKAEAVAKAMKLGITWDALLDLTDVIIANYNATPSRGLGGQSPLKVLENNLKLVSPLFLPRRLPPPTFDQPDLGVTVETRVVRGSQRHGRRPYTEIDGVRYTNALLARSFGLIGKQVLVHIRDANMCAVSAYFDNGQELGRLTAQGAWGRTPHTREMRKQIRAMQTAGEMILAPGDDPIEHFLKVLASRAYQNAMNHPNRVSRVGTKLASAANVSGKPIPEAEIQPEVTSATLGDTRNQNRPIPASIKSPVWKSVT